MRQRTGLALLTALLALTACAPSLTTGRDARATPAVPAAPSPTAAATVAPTAAPAAAPAATPTATAPALPEAARYRLAADYSRRHQGTAILVLRGDRIVFEDYQSEAIARAPQPIFSGTKSFGCLLAVAAAQDGLLTLDELVADSVPEWRADPRKARITIRHLLALSSGLDPATSLLQDRAVANVYARALDLPAVAEPGARFAYGDSHLAVFGEVLRRKLATRGEEPLAYLTRRLLQPLGLTDTRWQRDAAGNLLLASGARLTARDWAALGRFLVQRGQWQGQPLLPPDLLGQCFAPSRPLPAYGLTFWLNEPLPPAASRPPDSLLRVDRSGGAIYAGAPRDLAMAAGAGGQRLYLIPARDLVVVRLARGGDWTDRAFLTRLLDGIEGD
jgi:CubicO group peptidase (beta-lactamase class C family)